MKYLAALMLLCCTFAYAQQDYPRSITLSWTNPVLYTTGETIQPGDLADTRLVCIRNSGETVLDELVPVSAGPGGPEEATFTAIPNPGTYTCEAFAITIDGESSDASAAVSVKYTGKPNPPNNVNGRK